MKRRDFVKYTTAGLVGVAVGSRLRLPSIFQTEARAAPIPITMSMVADTVQMVDTIQVPHWLFTLDDGVAEPPGQASFPGPVIFAFVGDTIQLTITNRIPGPDRAFHVVGTPGGYAPVYTSPALPFDIPITFSISGLAPGTYLYKDPTNDPISRVLGLHGALVILPTLPASAPITNPYSPSTPRVTALFNALGVGTPRSVSAFFPGQKWFATTDNTGYVPGAGSDSDIEHHEVFTVKPNGPLSAVLEHFLYRTRIWLHSTIDPEMNQAVIFGPSPISPATFMDLYNPQYFSLNGRMGGYSAHSPDLTPISTVGEPNLVRILNAGLASHSPHLHANHFYVTAVNNVVGGGGVYFGNSPGDDIVVFLDTVTLGPQDRIDILIPYIRPPDIPMVLENNTLFRPGTDTPAGQLLKPLDQLAFEELNLVLIVPQNPMTWPMHSHMELDQTAAGGNYPQGSVTQLELIGEFGDLFFPPAL